MRKVFHTNVALGEMGWCCSSSLSSSGFDLGMYFHSSSYPLGTPQYSGLEIEKNDSEIARKKRAVE
ncbi:hypothetical protein [Candidatus Bartonella washoeensis]|uniref:hypothetical protein n=1 Tax=Candidatus Bartonella washoeensis TaxID=186739 RepID=UPI0015EB8F47|nr:hypothetical protein [Bartonella washoeensis]